MDKGLRITISILIAYIISLTSIGLCVNIKCKYEMKGYAIIGTKYRCVVSNDLNITSQNVSIESVTGNHASGIFFFSKTNSDVLGFYVDEKNVEYLPTGLEKFFANLKAISYWKCHVKEVHQADLKPFPKLVGVAFDTNDILVLEEGLFDYNPELKYIDFENNKIVHIHADIFNHLTKLSYLWLNQNSCVNMKAVNDKYAVQNMIKNLKEKCTDSDYEKIKNSLNELQKIAKNPLLEDVLSIGEKVEKVKGELKSSKFANYSTFNSQVQRILTTPLTYGLQEKLRKEMKEMKEQTSQSLFNLKVMCYMIVAFCGPLMTVFILAIYEYGGDFFTRLRSNRQQVEEEEGVEESSGVE